ncbi:uncharacterized protein K444DRAFT_204067 [Hyaloscypha bicolor E]|uniref:Uncharacterized protein n=1 Tax=Hyaloscypha bicolor E TaxID=1095630 RepID=A0A2J6TNU2_9HELO|nr:uncharacterized protein K444DRAFT_204067 [Hyaloscypha bicolor E]PMD64682.1 hypothetical protein K444DRAFT_204067 [Hyaloscypha bicolor E]
MLKSIKTAMQFFSPAPASSLVSMFWFGFIECKHMRCPMAPVRICASPGQPQRSRLSASESKVCRICGPLLSLPDNCHFRSSLVSGLQVQQRKMARTPGTKACCQSRRKLTS